MIPHQPSRTEPTTLSVVVVGRDRVTIDVAAPSLLVSIEASVARVIADRFDVTLDRSGVVVVPTATKLAITAASGGSRIAVLSFHRSLIAAVAHAYRELGFERARFLRWLDACALLPRTVWVHEIVHRYVFERHALGVRANPATRFLESEVVKELYYLFRDREAGADRVNMLRTHGASVEHALAYIEAHLFDSCSIAKLVAYAAVSESTLLRAFRRELGTSPGSYWRGRKLDEALALVRAGSYSIAEIAEHIGYDNATAFGHAFRARFGRPPSKFRV